MRKVLTVILSQRRGAFARRSNADPRLALQADAYLAVSTTSKSHTSKACRHRCSGNGGLLLVLFFSRETVLPHSTTTIPMTLHPHIPLMQRRLNSFRRFFVGIGSLFVSDTIEQCFPPGGGFLAT